MPPAASIRPIDSKAHRIKVKLASLVNKFDVRTSLNEDTVLQLMGAYEAQDPVPLIEVVRLDDDKFAYVDGRHRGQALLYLHREETDAWLLPGTWLDYKPVELLAKALKVNWGGARPPTRDDIVHTILRMIESGGRQEEIKEALGFLPAGSLRAYIQQAKSTLGKRKLNKAIDELVSGRAESVEDAARRQKVKIETLQNAILGRKSQGIGGAVNSDGQLAISYKAHVANQMKAMNKSTSKKMEYLLKQVEDGEISYTSAAHVLKDWDDRLRRSRLACKDWLDRLDAMVKPDESARVKIRE